MDFCTERLATNLATQMEKTTTYSQTCGYARARLHHKGVQLVFKRLMGEVEKWTLVLLMVHLSTLFYMCPGGIFIIINLIDMHFHVTCIYILLYFLFVNCQAVRYTTLTKLQWKNEVAT